MTVEYTIRVKNGKKYIDSEWRGSNCWSGFYNQITRILESSREQWGLPKDHRLRFEVRLHLDIDTEYFDKVGKARSVEYDEIFDELFKPMLKGVCRRYFDKGLNRRTLVVFSDECPYWVMVAASSIYRYYTDVAGFRDWWYGIKKVEQTLQYTMHPMTRYFIAICAGTGKEAALFRRNPDEESRGFVYVGHTAFEGSRVRDPEDVRFFHGWTIDNVISGREGGDFEGTRKGHPPMGQGAHTNPNEHCRNVGRDAFFSSSSRSHDNWLIKPNMPAPEDYYERLEWQRNLPRIHIPSFIKETVIKNNL